MRLFLSSQNVGNHPHELVRLAGENKRLAYITNAGDSYDPDEHIAKVAEHEEQFGGLGFEFVVIDLRQYFNEKVPENMLDAFGLVWCPGGNTFVLRAAMQLSGFDEVLVRKIRANEVAYGGSSAGSIIMGPTLRGTEHGDNPEDVAKVYSAEVMWDGLGLVGFVVIPHWQSDWFGKDALRMQRALELDRHKISYRTLTDGEVILVDGDKEELLK